MRSASGKILIFLVVLAAGALAELVSDREAGFFVGAFVIALCLFASVFRSTQKARKQNEEQISKCVYEYEVYDDHLIIRLKREQETIRWQKIYFSWITAMSDYGLKKNFFFQPSPRYK